MFVHETPPLSYSAIPKNLLFVFEQRREKITDDPTRAGFDFNRHCHARRQIDHLVLNLHLCAIQRHSRRVVHKCPGMNYSRRLWNIQRWSQFLRQRAKVDSPMQRMSHHEDLETVFG